MSDPEFRRLPPDRLPAYRRLVDYAFHPGRGPWRDDAPAEVPDPLGRQFGVVEDGELRAACTHHDFTVSLRGEWVPLAALSNGTTAPGHRRRGYLGELLAGSLRRCRGEYPLAALWPFDYGCYERFGWATSSRVAEYTCPPAALTVGSDVPGTVERVAPDDWGRLRGVTESYGRDHELVHRRDEQWWRERVFRTRGGDERRVSAVVRDGTVRGYVAYRVVSDGDARRLVALYNAFVDHDAFRVLLGMLSNQAPGVSAVTLYRNAETPVFDVVADPTVVDCELRPGTMVRVVDVVDALETVPYPDGVAGTVTLSVSDGVADWNDGTFELSVSDGEGTCRRVDTVDPDVALDVGTLSQLVVGYHSVPEARRLADLRPRDGAAASRLSEWFPPRTVDPMDDF